MTNSVNVFYRKRNANDFCVDTHERITEGIVKTLNLYLTEMK